MKKKKITIALDAMGGDNAPYIVVDGAKIVAKSNNNVYFLFYGDSDKIKPLIEKYEVLRGRYTIIHTNQSISGDDKPSVALRRGTNSSMRLAINSVKEGLSDAVVSAGNTGALMTISKVVLRVLPTIERPAIVSIIPNQKKQATIMLDLGANINSGSDVLYQFAVMGYAFAKISLKIAKPTIGLLNIGSEELKGSDAVKNASTLIKESHLSNSFYGYVEGDDITKGTVDVVVTDGFCGNITLKSMEGTAKMFIKFMKDMFKTSILAKIGLLISFLPIRRILKRMDPRLYNGAMLIGLNGIVVKSHGGIDKKGFANAIKVANDLVEHKINDKIINEIKSSDFYEANNNNN